MDAPGQPVVVITGASSGIGRETARLFAARGAAAARERFGRVDVWVNNAAVSGYGRRRPSSAHATCACGRRPGRGLPDEI